MEINIKLEFEKPQDWTYDKKILQGIFYSMIKNEAVHDSEYGLFCYSNIYFETKQQFQPGETYNLRFRSIDKDIINTVYEKLLLQKTFDFGKDNKINIKKAFVDNVDDVWSGKIIKTHTPIVLSLSQELCQKYDIDYDVKPGRPLYWNSNMGMGLEAFVKQLNKNIINKYVYLLKNDYIGYHNDMDNKFLNMSNDVDKLLDFAESLNFFDGYKFVNDALMNYKGGKIAGSKREFKLTDNKNLLKILKHIKLIGLGEKTSIGFGFID